MIIKNTSFNFPKKHFKNIFDYTVKDCNNKDVNLNIYKNYKNILIVNVASY